MKKLIINADDFGYSREVTDGIVHAHHQGCVTSTTLMANMPAWEYAAGLAGELPELSIGVHLTLTQGYPVLPPEQVPSLVDERGHFKSYPQVLGAAWRFRLNREEIEAELAAQVQRLLDAGVEPTHADSHHHSTMYPQTFLAMMRVLRQFDIRRLRTHRCWFVADATLDDPAWLRRRCWEKRLRDLPKQMYYQVCDGYAAVRGGIRTPDQRYGLGRVVSDHRLTWDLEDWRRYLASAPDGLSELSCHPGFRHESEEDRPEMREQRVRELEFLAQRSTTEAVAEAGISLVSYRDL